MRLKTTIFAVIIFSCGYACPDMIYFKDGGAVEGAIQQENNESVIINLGSGTMTVRQDEIDHIEKILKEDGVKPEQENKDIGIMREEASSPGCEEIKIAYLNTIESRRVFRRAKNNSLSHKNDISQTKKTISELLGVLDKKSRELKTIDSDKRTKEYNAVVADMNSTSARLNAEDGKLQDMYAEEKEASAVAAEKANKYRANFQIFKNALLERWHGKTGSETRSNETSFLEEMDTKITEMESDFKKDLADYTSEDSQIIVNAVIDGNVLARLVMDTGASIIVISKNIADRLAEESCAIEDEIEIVLADGTSVSAKPVILKSVKVGDAEVKNVQAAILEKSLIGGTDGLLGMSFLSNFVISVDASANKLILEHIL